MHVHMYEYVCMFVCMYDLLVVDDEPIFGFWNFTDLFDNGVDDAHRRIDNNTDELYRALDSRLDKLENRLKANS